MSNIDVFNRILSGTLDIPIGNLKGITRKTCESWDSLNHMIIIAELEKSFSCQFYRDDILGFSSYQTGISILQTKGINI